MSSKAYETRWQEALSKAKILLGAESSQDLKVVPKDANGWTVQYLNWLAVIRDLEDCHDKTMSAPLREAEFKGILEAAYGHMLEIRLALVQAAGHKFRLDGALCDLKLTADAARIPVPRYFVEERSQDILERRKRIAKLTEQHKPQLDEFDAKSKAQKAKLSAAVPVLPSTQAQSAAASATEDESDGGVPGLEADNQLSDSRPQSPSAKGSSTPHNLIDQQVETDESAQLATQEPLKREDEEDVVQDEIEDEMIFLGMRPKREMSSVLRADETALRERKKKQRTRQNLLQVQKLQIHDKLLKEEGPYIKETVQDKISDWFLLEHEKMEDNFPDLPSEQEGGSSAINAAAPPSAGPKSANSKKPAKTAPSGGKGKNAKPRMETSKVCLADLQAALDALEAKWNPVGNEADAEKEQDERLLKAAIRPIVQEEVRKEVDAEMGVLLHQLKDKLLEERAALAGTVKGKKGKGRKKGTKSPKSPPKSPAKKEAKSPKSPSSPKSDKASGTPKPVKKLPDLTADWTAMALVEELVKNGILVQTPELPLESFKYSADLVFPALPKPTKDKRKPAADKSQTQPPAEDRHCSAAEVLEAIKAGQLLPLGSLYLASRAGPDASKTLLLYGPEGTGKKMLAKAIATSSAAAFFDLSPWNTDGKFGGKEVALMVHMVFKVAKLLAPSVIFLDDVEKVIIGDKKRQAAFGGSEPFSRIKKDVLKEVAALEASHQVLLIGISTAPQACVRADEDALTNLFPIRYLFGLPNYANRRAIWAGLLKSHGLVLTSDQELTTLTHLSEGYTAGRFVQAIQRFKASRIPQAEQPLAAKPNFIRSEEREETDQTEKNSSSVGRLSAGDLIKQLAQFRKMTAEDLKPLREEDSKSGKGEGKKDGKDKT